MLNIPLSLTGTVQDVYDSAAHGNAFVSSVRVLPGLGFSDPAQTYASLFLIWTDARGGSQEIQVLDDAPLQLNAAKVQVEDRSVYSAADGGSNGAVIQVANQPGDLLTCGSGAARRWGQHAEGHQSLEAALTGAAVSDATDARFVTIPSDAKGLTVILRAVASADLDPATRYKSITGGSLECYRVTRLPFTADAPFNAPSVDTDTPFVVRVPELDLTVDGTNPASALSWGDFTLPSAGVGDDGAAADSISKLYWRPVGVLATGADKALVGIRVWRG